MAKDIEGGIFKLGENLKISSENQKEFERRILEAGNKKQISIKYAKRYRQK
jgi:hypothetical protein